MLTVDIQSSPPAVVLSCSGKIVLGMEAETLRCIARSRSERFVFLDLQQVQSLDAAGIGLLIELQRWARDSNRIMVLMNVGRRVRNLIGIVKLDAVLGIAGQAAAADFEAADRDEASRACAMTA